MKTNQKKILTTIIILILLIFNFSSVFAENDNLNLSAGATILIKQIKFYIVKTIMKKCIQQVQQKL